MKAIKVLLPTLVLFIGTSLIYCEDEDSFNQQFENAITTSQPPTDSLSIALIYMDQGTVKEAMDHLLNHIQTHPESLTLLKALGQMFYYRVQYDQAISLFESYLMLKELSKTDNTLINLDTEAIKLLCQSYKNIGEYDKALTHYQKVLDLSMENNNLPLQCEILTLIGELYLYREMPDEALEHLSKAVQIGKDHNLKPLLIQAEIQYGSALIEKKDYEKAYQTLNHALLLSQQLRNEILRAEVLLYIALLQIKKNQISVAETNLRQAENILSNTNLIDKIGLLYSRRGYLKREREQYEDSINWYNKALNLYDEAGYKPEKASALNDLGLVFYRIEDYEKAIYYFLRSIKIRKQMGDKPNLSVAYYNLGTVYMAQRDILNAILAFTLCADLDRSLNNPTYPEVKRTLDGLLMTAENQGIEVILDYENFWATIDQIDQQTPPQGIEIEQITEETAMDETSTEEESQSTTTESQDPNQQDQQNIPDVSTESQAQQDGRDQHLNPIPPGGAPGIPTEQTRTPNRNQNATDNINQRQEDGETTDLQDNTEETDSPSVNGISTARPVDNAANMEQMQQAAEEILENRQSNQDRRPNQQPNR